MAKRRRSNQDREGVCEGQVSAVKLIRNAFRSCLPNAKISRGG